MTKHPGLIERMKRTVVQWTKDEPSGDWWQYQHDFAEAADAIAELAEALRALSFSAYDYAGNYLLDERDDPDLCFAPNHHARIVALFAAIEAADESLAKHTETK